MVVVVKLQLAMNSKKGERAGVEGLGLSEDRVDFVDGKGEESECVGWKKKGRPTDEKTGAGGDGDGERRVGGVECGI